MQKQYSVVFLAAKPKWHDESYGPFSSFEEAFNWAEGQSSLQALNYGGQTEISSDQKLISLNKIGDWMILPFFSPNPNNF